MSMSWLQGKLAQAQCNPETMTQIEQAGGLYLIQVKENQPKLLEHCRTLAEQSPLAETIEHDCGHGFITTRQANLHNMQLSGIDNRWQRSGLRTLVVMNRETFAKSSQQTTNESAYYLSHLLYLARSRLRILLMGLFVNLSGYRRWFHFSQL